MGLAFIFYHLQRTTPMPHLGIAGAVISNWKAGHAKGESDPAKLHLVCIKHGVHGAFMAISLGAFALLLQ